MSFRELLPGDPAYESVLAELFNGDAAASKPHCIVQPCSEADVASLVRRARRDGRPLKVRSGGHSRFCSGDGALMLDLSANFRSIRPTGSLVRVQGGVGMGALLQCLALQNRMVPVGTHPTPGFGLLTMGGIGYLSRSLGLTLDNVLALRGVRGDGETFALSSKGEDASGWRFLLGAAPFLAVITEATLKTYPRRPLSALRQLFPLSCLGNALECAERLPSDVSCSFVLGVPPDEDQAMALRYVVMSKMHSSALLDASRQQSVCWWAQAAGLEHLPDFNLPYRDGSLATESPPDSDRHQRLRSWIYAISVPPGVSAELAPLLAEAIVSAPTSLCRIDLQHTGGVVRDHPMESSLYRGRQAEWSIVVTGCWSAGDTSAELDARRWVDGVFQKLEPFACHLYFVERHPETARYARELELAYGPDLEPLRAMKREWDPDGILPSLGVR